MSLLHQIIQRVERLLDGRCRIETVELIKIDVIELQPSQTLFDALHDMKTRTAAGIDAGRTGFAKDFGSHHHVLARNLQVF